MYNRFLRKEMNNREVWVKKCVDTIKSCLGKYQNFWHCWNLPKEGWKRQKGQALASPELNLSYRTKVYKLMNYCKESVLSTETTQAFTSVLRIKVLLDFEPADFSGDFWSCVLLIFEANKQT